MRKSISVLLALALCLGLLTTGALAEGPAVTIVNEGLEYSKLEVTQSGELYEIDATVRGLEASAANGETCHWLALLIAPPEGAETMKNQVGSSSMNLTLPEGAEEESVDGGWQIYLNLDAQANWHNWYGVVRWFDENGESLGDYKFRFDTSYTYSDNRALITMLEVVGGAVPSISYDEEGNGTITLTGGKLASDQEYTLRYYTNVGGLGYQWETVTIGAGGKPTEATKTIKVEDILPEGAEGRAASTTYTIIGNFETLEHINAIEPGETEVSVGENIAEDKKEMAEAFAGGIEAADIGGLIRETVGTEVNAIEGLEEAAEEAFPGAGDVQIKIEPYLTVEATGYKEEGESKTLSLEISAKYRTYAVSGDGQNEITLGGASGSIGMDEPIELTVSIPEGFEVANNTPVYIKHIKDGSTYYYVGYAYENSVRFTSHNGLSPFEIQIGGEDPRAATIDGVGYASLQEAVDEVGDGQVISVLKDCSAVVDREISFIIAQGVAGEVDIDITAAEGYTLSKSGSTYTVTKAAAAPDEPAAPPPVLPEIYGISVQQPEGGSVKAKLSNASAGSVVRVEAVPEEGYELLCLIVNGERVYGDSFVMPEGEVTLSALFVRAGAEFSDVAEGDWYYDAVSRAVAGGLMDGVGGGSFDPNGAMTRAMVWAVLARLDGRELSGEGWQEAALSWALDSGVSDGTNASGSVTRQELVTMLYRFALSPETGGGLDGWPDGSAVAAWAGGAFSWAVSEGIINGVDGLLAPASGATRAQCAAILTRFAGLSE